MRPQEPELSWIATARSYIGVREVKGLKTAPVIAGWLHELKAWWNDDETPWCGVFVAHCLQTHNLKIPNNWMRAQEYLKIGTVLTRAAYGCIVIFKREGGGHVGFVVGMNERGHLMVLGGNQGDEVSIRPFGHDRIIGYRWPSVAPQQFRYDLPLLQYNGELSKNEA